MSQTANSVARSRLGAKKDFGKLARRAPLPAVKNLPVLYRYDRRENDALERPTPAQPEPTDAEYLRIEDVESGQLAVSPDVHRHHLTVASNRILQLARVDSRGILQPGWDSLDIYRIWSTDWLLRKRSGKARLGPI